MLIKFTVLLLCILTPFSSYADETPEVSERCVRVFLAATSNKSEMAQGELLTGLRSSFDYSVRDEFSQNSNLETPAPSTLVEFANRRDNEASLRLRRVIQDGNQEVIARLDNRAIRAGVPSIEIAKTLREAAKYLKAKNIGTHHNELANEWLSEKGLVNKIAQAKNRDELAGVFGETSSTHYWPGAPIPTIIDVVEMLEFFAYHEEVENGAASQQNKAASLIKAIDKFRGDFGGRHLSVTNLDRERFAFKSSSRRISIPEVIDPVDKKDFNAINFALIWSLEKWIPAISNGKKIVEWQMPYSSKNSYKSATSFSFMKGALEVGFLSIGIRAEIQIEFGDTYGEDKIFVRLSEEDYLTKYIPIHLGEIEYDEEEIEKITGRQGMRPSIQSEYIGWEPNKRVFYGPYGGDRVKSTGLLVRQDEKDPQILKLVKWFTNNGESKALEAIDIDGQSFWIVSLPKRDYTKAVVLFSGRYYGSIDLYNYGNHVKRLIYDLSNGSNIASTSPSNPSNQKAVIRNSTHYLPYSGPFSQAAHQLAFEFGAKIETQWGKDLQREGIILGDDVAFNYYVIPEKDIDPVAISTLRNAISSIQNNLDSGGKGDVVLPQAIVEK